MDPNDQLNSLVSDRYLVGVLCRKRIDLARKHRRSSFVHRCSGTKRKLPQEELVGLLPPRRHWPRLIPWQRRSSEDLPRDVANALASYVLVHLGNSQANFRWIVQLRRFLEERRAAILNWESHRVQKPTRVIPIPKGRGGHGQKYRVLTTYDLKDAIADTVFAACLRKLIDSHLSLHCYAFRLPRDGRALTHHSAVDATLRFSERCRRQPLWVSECDITGFFDSVSHEVVRRELHRLLRDIGKTPSRSLVAFIDSFLSGYSYSDVRQVALQRLSRMKVSNPNIFDAAAARRKTGIPAKDGERLGIPQGSALSCVLANVVLASADEACGKVMAHHRRSFYARYCDDVVIASTNRRITQRAMASYRIALGRLELPFHPMEVVGPHDKRRYWRTKSKDVYRWTHPRLPGLHWLGFLGYQFRRDGRVRARASSIQKELAKQQRVVDDIIAAVDRERTRAARVGRPHEVPRLKRIRYRALMHLISIGVGYPTPYILRPATNSVCWASGFTLLRSPAVDRDLLRRLDRGRGVAMRRLWGRLSALLALGQVKEEPNELAMQKQFAIKFDGSPTSYYVQFDKPCH